LKKTIPLLFALSVLCLPVFQVWAQDEEVVHTVKKGDTLWDISNMYMKTPWSWPLIWSENEKITNPHLIYPGDKVIISQKDGAYQITIVPADGGESRAYTLQQLAGQKGRTVVLGPNFSCILYKQDKLTGLGTVVGKEDGGEYSTFNDRIIIKTSSPTTAKGFAVITLYKEIKQKDANDNDVTLGYLYRVVGLAAVTDTPSGLLKARVTYCNQEIKTGDIVTDDLTMFKPLTLNLNEVNLSSEGVIVDYIGAVTGASIPDVIVTNIGASDGLKPGSLLTIYKPQVIKGVGTIDNYAGLAVVIQTLDKSATALVMKSTDSLPKGCKVKAK
jgi:hypothetical protein